MLPPPPTTGSAAKDFLTTTEVPLHNEDAPSLGQLILTNQQIRWTVTIPMNAPIAIQLSNELLAEIHTISDWVRDHAVFAVDETTNGRFDECTNKPDIPDHDGFNKRVLAVIGLVPMGLP